MDIIGSLVQINPINHEETYIVVKVHDEFVGITFSEKHGSDMDIFFAVDQCEKIMQLLERALLLANKGPERN